MSKELYTFNKPTEDDTTKGGCPDTGYEPVTGPIIIKEEENNNIEEHPPKPIRAIAIIIVGLCIVAAGVLVGRSFVKQSAVVDPNDVIELDHDINFSQVKDLDTSSVDVLLKIKNTSESPIKSVYYKIIYQDEYYQNHLDGSELFFAYGQIKPGETGYMYSQIYLTKDNPRKQGTIVIDSVEKGSDLENYVIPNGKVTAFDKISDSYDVWILNPNDSDVNLRESVVVAVSEESDSLAGAWGCSHQENIYQEYVEAGKDATLTAAIHDPGFDYPIEDRTYNAFVIEKEVIGVD